MLISRLAYLYIPLDKFKRLSMKINEDKLFSPTAKSFQAEGTGTCVEINYTATLSMIT